MKKINKLLERFIRYLEIRAVAKVIDKHVEATTFKNNF